MKRTILLLLLCSSINIVFACTTFCINKDGQIVFGRNYDWVSGAGIVNTNMRGLLKTSMKLSDGKNVSWISRYGSISFNQYGKEFPTGGMNEKGLVVELMWLEGSTYAAPDNRPAVGVLQWIQYQLDNAATTDEVIGSDLKLRISKDNPPLHYLVADSTGNIATIEFLDGKMIVHRGSDLPFPVLTNNTYESSVKIAKQAISQNTINNIGDNSLERFATACSMINQFKANAIDAPIVDYSFAILNKVSQGSFTKWSIVYDITNRAIYFKTESNKDIKSLRFSAFEFSCSKTPMMFNMNQEVKGDISKLFTAPDYKVKEQVIDKAIRESADRVKIDAEERKQLLNFEKTVSCKL